MATRRYSLKTQIAEVERELELRRKSYPSHVSGRAMSQGEADLQIGIMESVRATLRWLAKHEETIKAIARARAREGGTEPPEGR